MEPSCGARAGVPDLPLYVDQSANARDGRGTVLVDHWHALRRVEDARVQVEAAEFR